MALRVETRLCVRMRVWPCVQTNRSRQTVAKWNSAKSPARAASAGRSRRGTATRSPTRTARRSPGRRRSPAPATSAGRGGGLRQPARDADGEDAEPSIAEKRRMVLQAKQQRATASGGDGGPRSPRSPRSDDMGGGGKAERSPETLQAREATRGLRGEQARQEELDARVQVGCENHSPPTSTAPSVLPSASPLSACVLCTGTLTGLLAVGHGQRMEQRLAEEKAKQGTLTRQLLTQARARVDNVPAHHLPPAPFVLQ